MFNIFQALLVTLQVCGALKNVVALAGGFCEGMGQGTNTKAAILRLGVEEIKTFTMLFFGDLLAVSYISQAVHFVFKRLLLRRVPCSLKSASGGMLDVVVPATASQPVRVRDCLAATGHALRQRRLC